MEVDLRIKQGSNFRRVVNVVENGVAKNLTGYSARMMIKESRGASATLLYDASANVTINDAPNGQLTINIPNTSTTAFTWNSGAYDLEVFNGTTDVISVLEGYISVMKEVTS